MRLAVGVLTVISLIATLGVVFAGVFNLSRQGHDPRLSNKLMRLRIALQGTTLLLLVLLFLVSR